MTNFFGHCNGSEFIFNNYRNFGQNDRFMICFSGELYDIHELYSKISTDIPSSSVPDIENLLYNLFLREGANFAERLNGNFTISIADRKENILYLFRDHIGISRIYFSKSGENLYFSDSIRTLFANYQLSDRVDINALNYFFTYRYIPADMTIFSNVRKLDPGSVLIFKPKSSDLVIQRYWTPPLKEAGIHDEEELAGQLDELLRKSVSRRLNSHCNNCALLSGGLDSSLNVALMRKAGARNIKTFTIGFEDGYYDESRYSGMVAQYFSTDHHRIVVGPDPSVFGEIGRIFEEPNGDPSVFPTYHLSRLVSGNCSSVICGDGADGLFLGLSTHRILSNYISIHRYAGYLSPILNFISGFLPDSVRWKIFLEGLTPEQFFLRRRTYFSPRERRQLLKKEVLFELGERLNSPELYGNELFNSYEGRIEGRSGYFTFSSNPDDILVKMGRLMNAVGISTRTPFLDKDLVNFSLGQISSDLKLKGGISKYILKRTAKKYLPQDLPIERKRGFNPPVSSWIEGEWWEYMRNTILDSRSDFIDPDFAERLLRNHKKSFYDESRKIFPLFMFRLWENTFLRQLP